MNQPSFMKALFSLGLLSIALGNARCAGQPDVKCTVTSGTGSARYTLVSKSAGCENTEFPFADIGERIGLEAYPPLVTDPDLENKVTTLALKSGHVGELILNAESQDLSDTDVNHKPYALGKFDAVYPTNSVCTASGFSTAVADLPLVPAHTAEVDGEMVDVEEQPATHIEYEWSNVRVIVTAASIGTQTFADLKYTQDGCSATYHVAILTPEVDCADDDGNPDQTLCNSEADPDHGFFGSGIGQGIPTTCDPTILKCLPNKTAP